MKDTTNKTKKDKIANTHTDICYRTDVNSLLSYFCSFPLFLERTELKPSNSDKCDHYIDSEQIFHLLSNIKPLEPFTNFLLQHTTRCYMDTTAQYMAEYLPLETSI